MQAAHQAVLLRLIDPAVFQRMAEGGAALESADRYVGVDLIRDLNSGLFSELQGKRPVVELYRRDLQRTYVLLLVARARGEALPTPPADDTDSPVAVEFARTPGHTLQSTGASRLDQSLPAGRSMPRQTESSVPSEFRAALRRHRRARRQDEGRPRAGSRRRNGLAPHGPSARAGTGQLRFFAPLDIFSVAPQAAIGQFGPFEFNTKISPNRPLGVTRHSS